MWLWMEDCQTQYVCFLSATNHVVEGHENYTLESVYGVSFFVERHTADFHQYMFYIPEMITVLEGKTKLSLSKEQ